MKKSLNLLLGLAFAVMCFSCDPVKDPVTPTPEDNSGTLTTPATPIGTPDGTAITATIGRAGGTVASADQRISISIPAGALTENKSISVQPITNNCPAGTGQAFRLEPHGITFAMPISVTFQCSQADVNSSAPELLLSARAGTVHDITIEDMESEHALIVGTPFCCPQA